MRWLSEVEVQMNRYCFLPCLLEVRQQDQRWLQLPVKTALLLSAHTTANDGLSWAITVKCIMTCSPAYMHERFGLGRHPAA